MFKKHIIDAEGKYRIGYWPKDKFQKFVNEDKPLYVEWLKDNTSEVIAYVAPPPKPLPTIEELKERAINRTEGKKRAEYYEKSWEASNEYMDLQIVVPVINKMTKVQLVAYIKGLK